MRMYGGALVHSIFAWLTVGGLCLSAYVHTQESNFHKRMFRWMWWLLSQTDQHILDTAPQRERRRRRHERRRRRQQRQQHQGPRSAQEGQEERAQQEKTPPTEQALMPHDPERAPSEASEGDEGEVHAMGWGLAAFSTLVLGSRVVRRQDGLSTQGAEAATSDPPRVQPAGTEHDTQGPGPIMIPGTSDPPRIQPAEAGGEYNKQAPILIEGTSGPSGIQPAGPRGHEEHGTQDPILIEGTSSPPPIQPAGAGPVGLGPGPGDHDTIEQAPGPAHDTSSESTYSNNNEEPDNDESETDSEEELEHFSFYSAVLVFYTWLIRGVPEDMRERYPNLRAAAEQQYGPPEDYRPRWGPIVLFSTTTCAVINFIAQWCFWSGFVESQGPRYVFRSIITSCLVILKLVTMGIVCLLITEMTPRFCPPDDSDLVLRVRLILALLPLIGITPSFIYSALQAITVQSG
ncbi:hypothetical protein B0T19DRAFT_413078 [Cercophora scortea]|uniref:Uncharacterized protein n=1 Tax=Cercophora scortea TaxID=314031 RepID=A0AAE0J5X2_9PEZI|nr:hypothetical protein B0T19DRAFT_413078 [Cercophora scortea]